MSSPSPPVWYLKSLAYKPQNDRDLVRSVWRAVAELDGVISQELARIQSTGIVAVVVSSTFHSSKTERERHWTSRVFASTPNGGSVYLGGLHSFSSRSHSAATFRPRRQDNKKSKWRRRTLADLNRKVRKLTVADV